MKQMSGQSVKRMGKLAAVLAAVLVRSAHAQNGSWTGSGTDSNWLNTANWVDGVLPGDWQSALFSSNVVNGTVNVNNYIGHNAFTVDAYCTTDILINGGRIPKNEAAITVTGANLTFNADLNAWYDQSFEVAGGKALTFNGRINQNFEDFSTAHIIISGAGSVVMRQAGLYSGGTTIKGGTLKTDAANGAGPGAMGVAAGATWDRGFASQTVAGLSGAGHVGRVDVGAVSTGSDGAAQISAGKNYVLKLDFEPGGGSGANVNGVQFDGVGTSGAGWALTGAPDPFNENGSLSGYPHLLSGFYYNGNPGVLTFSNLTVGKTYQIILFSDPGWGTRVENATFANGADSRVLRNTNPAFFGYYAYAFLATAPTATITMAPLDPGNAYHWYGATLEELAPPALTVGDANNYLFSGLIDGDVALVKQGTGTQTLAGPNTYTAGTAVNAGTLITTAANATGSGAMTVATGAAWQIWEGANQTVAGLSGTGIVATVSGVVVSTGPDGSSQLSATKNYVQLLDFGNAGGATVKGVTFSSVDNTSGTDWSLGVPTTYYADGGSGYGQLMSDFVYGGNPGTLTFSNLTVGKMYNAVLYTQIGAWADRWQLATFANGSDRHLLLRTDPGTVGYYSYQFVATDPTATITMNAYNPFSTYHWFGASLEEVTPAGAGTFAGGVTLTVGDAQDHRFDGIVSGALSLVKQGSGTQTLAGPNTYSGSTTVSNGTLKLLLPPPPAGTVAVPNASFETHDALANGNWGYTPSGASWTFDAASGIAAPDSPWVAASAVLDGAYAAYIQNSGTLSQAITIPASGTYLLTFKAANRPGFSASGLGLTIDGVSLSNFVASAFESLGMFQTFTVPAEISAGTRTLAFSGVQNGADSATAIDRITLSGVGGSLSTNSPVVIAAGAWLDLGGSTQTVSRLYCSGIERERGTHGAIGSGATFTHSKWFAGSGMLNVLSGKSSGMLIMLN